MIEVISERGYKMKKDDKVHRTENVLERLNGAGEYF